MLIGIAFASVLTGNIFSYFIAQDTNEKVQEKDTTSENELILRKLDELSRRVEELDEKISNHSRA